MGQSFGRFPVFALCAILAVPLTLSQPAFVPEVELQLSPAVHRKKRSAARALPARYRRGKRAQAKPRRRSNRLIISKRVRRKHRRAA